MEDIRTAKQEDKCENGDFGVLGVCLLLETSLFIYVLLYCCCNKNNVCT